MASRVVRKTNSWKVPRGCMGASRQDKMGTSRVVVDTWRRGIDLQGRGRNMRRVTSLEGGVKRWRREQLTMHIRLRVLCTTFQRTVRSITVQQCEPLMFGVFCCDERKTSQTIASRSWEFLRLPLARFSMLGVQVSTQTLNNVRQLSKFTIVFLERWAQKSWLLLKVNMCQITKLSIVHWFVIISSHKRPRAFASLLIFALVFMPEYLDEKT